jgi:hypothetical protein
MIVLFTDFGVAGPYVGQMKAVLARDAPGVPVVDLFADAPSRDPRAAAYLLAAYAAWFPTGTVFLAVIDPGVGSERAALAVRADERWYVGPDNGLFELVLRRASEIEVWEIAWRPEKLSASFHGRDLFAPQAALIARGVAPQGQKRASETVRRPHWPDDFAAIVYVDHYGNAITGLRAASHAPGARLRAGGRTISRARTFDDVVPGEALWYENSNGLAEIAVNLGRASDSLGLAVGAEIFVES